MECGDMAGNDNKVNNMEIDDMTGNDNKFNDMERDDMACNDNKFNDMESDDMACNDKKFNDMESDDMMSNDILRDSKVQIMGILNATPDSYFAPSRAMLSDDAARRAEKMVEEGASYIDVGACSTRPGSELVPEEEEWKRLSDVLPAVRMVVPSNVKISIDSFRWGVIERCLDLVGEVVVNDISAGEDDSEMLPEVGRLHLEYIAMHKRGIPSVMQSMCEYGDVTEAVKDYFSDFAVKAADFGITEWILDPGFGFAKTPEQCMQLLDRLSEFRCFNRPILVGISRKSMIYKPMGLTAYDPEVLAETQKLHRKAVQSGASILRVHDVSSAVRACVLSPQSGMPRQCLRP